MVNYLTIPDLRVSENGFVLGRDTTCLQASSAIPCATSSSQVFRLGAGGAWTSLHDSQSRAWTTLLDPTPELRRRSLLVSPQCFLKSTDVRSPSVEQAISISFPSLRLTLKTQAQPVPAMSSSTASRPGVGVVRYLPLRLSVQRVSAWAGRTPSVTQNKIADRPPTLFNLPALLTVARRHFWTN